MGSEYYEDYYAWYINHIEVRRMVSRDKNQQVYKNLFGEPVVVLRDLNDYSITYDAGDSLLVNLTINNIGFEKFQQTVDSLYKSIHLFLVKRNIKAEQKLQKHASYRDS
jgi:hypothetical protein